MSELRWTVNICRTHGPVPVYWQADQRGPRCSHYLRTKRPCGLPAPLIDVIEAAPVEAELAELRGRHRVLLEGMRERGFGVGRNPDGDDQTPETALLVIDEYAAELERLRKIEAAAQAVVACTRGLYRSEQTTTTALARARALDHLREVLGEPSDA